MLTAESRIELFELSPLDTFFLTRFAVGKGKYVTAFENTTGERVGEVDREQAEQIIAMLRSQFPDESYEKAMHPVAHPEQSKLEYFAARAPAEPQSWFRPTMPEPPKVRQLHEWQGKLSQNVYEDLRLYTQDDWDPETQEGRAWAAEHQAERKALEEWELECKKQRQIQWPFAWARAVIASQNGDAR
jgi:hypothetical protein